MTQANNTKPSRVTKKKKKSTPEPNGAFNFIVATHFEDFANADNRRTVRSEAMKWHRAQPVKKDGDDTASPSPVPVLTPSPSPSPGLDPVFVTETGRKGQNLGDVLPFRSGSSCQTFGDNLQLGAPAVRLPRGHTVGTDAYWLTTGRVTSYESTEDHQQLMVHLLLSVFDPRHQYGDAKNALALFFKFNHPSISADVLLCEYVGLFGTEAMMLKWPGLMTEQFNLMLSSTLLATLWNEVYDPLQTDINWTAVVKQEVTDLVNDALSDPVRCYNDATLMALSHLLIGEIWSSDEQESTSGESEKLISRIIHCRGGIHHVSPGVQDVVAAHCYHWAVACEAKPTNVFDAWSPQDLPKIGVGALPESPLFRQTATLDTVCKSPQCSTVTGQILNSMCELTDLFVTGNTDAANTSDIKLEDQARGSQSLLKFHYKATDVRERLKALQSACKPDLETSNDWVYEACRIVALIYVTALIERSPFSVAARSDKFVSNPSSGSIIDAQESQRGSVPSPIAALVGVLRNTNTANIWGDMAGVFYWICAVGAAAARSPTPTDGGYSPPLNEERQYLNMHATRAMTILVYEHATPVIMAMRKLLKIQSILGSHDSKTEDD